MALERILTLEEQAIFKADILSWNDPERLVWRSNLDCYSAIEWYNTIATPDWIIWKTRLTRDEIFNATVLTGPGGLIERTASEQFIYRIMFDLGTINPSYVNVRNAFVTVFSGT